MANSDERGNARAIEQLLEQALGFHNAGRLADAARAYDAILALDGRHAMALTLRGTVNAQQGDFQEAARLLQLSLDAEPRQPVARNSLGIALKELARYEEALASFSEAIALQPDLADAYCNRGNTLRELRRYDEAMADYDRALAINPGLAQAHHNCALTLQDLKRHEEAAARFSKAIRLGHPEAYNGLGNALQDLKRHTEAIESYRKAIALKPDYADAYTNCGNVLQKLKRYRDALAFYDRAIAAKGDLAENQYSRGLALEGLLRFDEALAGYRKVIEIAPRRRDVLSRYVFLKLCLCSWDGLREAYGDLVAAFENGSGAPSSFVTILMETDPRIQKRAAELSLGPLHAHPPAPLWRGERYTHDKIRICYLSADYYSHATAFLIVGMLEQHDRSRFETIAISFSKDDNTKIRHRIGAAFDRFIDARNMSDADVARLMRTLEIDIAIDLKGLTEDARPEIFAHRPAPVQVAYLGYPGTCALPSIDYIVADRIVIPPDEKIHFTEQVVYLPDTYQCNDSKRPIAQKTPTRAEAGLPETGFVFCSFNISRKLTPEIFDIWMRLLKSVEGSVLWLLEENEYAANNLRREARARGVSEDRLVFAKRVDSEAHLARQPLADIFLDTLPFCAHTTASDALWAGLPVLTCAGTTFAGRVAASLLGAIGLPELVTHSLVDYEALALRLALEPDLLSGIKRKLADNRETYPLFDTIRFTRHIEAAYEIMWRRSQSGLPPESFSVGDE